MTYNVSSAWDVKLIVKFQLCKTKCLILMRVRCSAQCIRTFGDDAAISNKNLAIANRSRVSCAHSNPVTLKSRLRVTQGHWKRNHWIDHTRLTYYQIDLFDLEMWVRGHSRSLKMVSSESLGTVSYSPSIVTMTVSCIIPEIKRDIGRKSRFFIPALHSTSPLGGWYPTEYCHSVWYGKTKNGLATWRWKKFEDTCSRTDNKRTCDRRADRQTDGRTDR